MELVEGGGTTSGLYNAYLMNDTKINWKMLSFWLKAIEAQKVTVKNQSSSV